MKRALDLLADALTIIVIIGAVLFLLLPLVVAVFMAFDARTYLGPFPPTSLSLQWFERFFSNALILRGLRTSLLLALTTTTVSTVIGLLAALALQKYIFPGKNFIISILMSPMVIPAVVIGFSLLLVFSLLDVRVGFLKLLGGHVILTIPYATRAILASLVTVRPSMVEAALSLGASDRRAFFDITLPLARPGIVAGMIFSFAISMDDVAASLFLTDATAVTLPVALISLMRSNFDLTIAAAAVLLIFLTIAIIVVLDRIMGIDRLVGTAIK